MAAVAGRSRLKASLRFGLPWVILVAALFWALVLPRAERSVFGRVPILDEVYYLDRARDGSAPGGHFVTPLYPRLIAWVGSGLSADGRLAEGPDLRGIRLLQIACWLGTLILLRLIAGRLYGDTGPPGWPRNLAVWLPAALFGFYLPGAVYAVSILLELPLIFLVTLAVWGVLWLNGRRTWWGAVGLGVVLGLAGLLRGSTLVLVPIAGVALVAGLRSWRLPVLMMTISCLVIFTASVHNSRLAGEPVGPTLNGGVNLAIGNGPEANGFYVAVVPGDWRTDPAGVAYLADRYDEPGLTLAGADRHWRDYALDWMQKNPSKALGLWGKKVWLHLQAWEIDQLTSLKGWTRSAPALRILVVPYGLLVVLGLVGLTVGRNDRRFWFLAAALFALMGAQSFFFVVSRYRLVLVPLWALLAGGAVPRLMDRDRVTLGVLVVGALIVLPWGLGDVRERFTRLTEGNEALRWAIVGELDQDAVAVERAIGLYRASLEGGHGSPSAYLGLGAVLRTTGDVFGAETVLSEGVTQWPDRLEIAKAQVALWLESGNLERAFAGTEAILASHPRDADTLHNAVILLGRAGRPDEAMARAAELIDAHPDDPRGYNDLGILQARAGDLEAARATFTRGLAAVPDHAELRRNLSLLPPAP
jgi:hypothetical protein